MLFIRRKEIKKRASYPTIVGQFVFSIFISNTVTLIESLPFWKTFFYIVEPLFSAI